MRGKVCHPHLKKPFPGITPACAGKSSTATRAARSTGDHPRICGEKQKSSGAGLRKWGSPPRMRGKGCMFCCSPAKVGITPAYAGKSLLCMDFCPAYRDHPRVCGEKLLPSSFLSSSRGSPPRVRGKVRRRPRLQCPGGITPAYAGKRVQNI